MRVAVIVVWRPKGFPDWHGRRSPGAQGVPRMLADDASAAPYTGVHLAGLLPRHWQVSLVHEMVQDVDLDMAVDAVLLSTLDFCAAHARWLGQQFRARGVRVVVGGLFPTLNPGYFAGAADAVVVGEAEPVLARLTADLERGRLEPIYRAETPADLSDLPPPRYDLLEPRFRIARAYEATRGCPFTCSFCVLSVLRNPYRMRPVEQVVRDIRAVPPGWSWLQRKYVNFWDNNLGADRRYFRDLCAALAPLKLHWGTETSLDTLTEESARMMGRAGCRFLFIGLESLAQASLQSANKRHNQVSEYRQRLGWAHQNGIVVMSILLLGLDDDTAAYAERLPDLIDQVGIDIPVLSFAAPIEGTPFRAALAGEGRLLPGDLNYGLDGAHLVYRPRRISPDELELALFHTMRRVHSLPRLIGRSWRRLRHGLLPAANTFGANLFYRGHQRSIARSGLGRIAARGPWPGEARRQADAVATETTLAPLADA